MAPLRNLVAAVFRLEKSRTLETVREIVASLLEWLGAPEDEGLRRAMTIWLRRVLLPSRLPGTTMPPMEDLQEVNRVLEEQTIDWTLEWREAGRKEGAAGILARLLERRFGPLDDNLRQRLGEADSDTLLEWSDRILTAQRLEDVLD